ncbi:ROK family protein [Modestobacter marinus]|uniref:ROK family protein n=1 Tax=Modestobacter marinus TaxID=477641 RepID=UPI001C988A39|nr:hypothetical protein [Modestobacter marinus]
MDDAPATVAIDQLDALVVVLDLVRTFDSGLLEEGALAPSAGGRAPRELRFCADAGHLLVAEVGATSVEVAVTDLNGALLHRQRGDGDVTRGPDYGLGQVEAVFDAALAARPAGALPIWGIGVSGPGPVEFATGQPVAPPIMPGWDRYPIRKRLAQRFPAEADRKSSRLWYNSGGSTALAQPYFLTQQRQKRWPAGSACTWKLSGSSLSAAA